MKYLLVIDDENIRKAAFVRADQIIKKIDRLEQDLELFHKQDQRLFSSWFDLTFRAEKKTIADRRDELELLSKFHNWMIALAQQLDISLPKALMMLRQEEADYARGTDELKAIIDEKRRQRDEFIRKAVEREFGFDSDRDPDSDSDSNSDESETAFLDSGPPRTREEEARIETIRQMDDEKIRNVCLQRNPAFSLLATVLALARSLDDQVLFLRVWEIVPRKHQTAFAQNISEKAGISIYKLIGQIKDRLAQGESIGSEDEESLSDYSEEFIDSRSSRAREKSSTVDHEATKHLYRKLVRHLHPDLQTDQDGQSHWQKQIWFRVQAAYGLNDRGALEKLYRLVLIRARNLNELSVSEIVESQSWLKEEFDQLGREAKGLRNLPSWGFSKKKDYASLKRRLEKPLSAELEDIDVQLRELKSHHAYLERQAQSTNQGDQRRRKRGRSHRGTGRQTSFFD